MDAGPALLAAAATAAVTTAAARDLPPELRGTEAARIDLATFSPAPESYGDHDLHHYAWLLDEEQRRRYEGGDEAARREVVRVAFAAIDPTPTTPENERREEHFRRVACALAMFPSPGSPWWDDRGELVIRYGAPDSRGTSIGSAVEPNREVWVYSRLQLAFELEDPQLSDRFRLVVQRSRKAVRDDRHFETAIDFGVPVRPWGFNDPFPTVFRVPDFEARKIGADFQRLLDRGAEALTGIPEIDVHDYGAEWLPVAFDAVSFESERPGRTRLEVHTGIRAGDLTYERVDGLWRAAVAVDAVVKTADFREVARTRKLAFDHRTETGDREDRLVLDGLDLDLEPGRYLLAIAVEDTTSRRIGTFQREVEVIAFPPGVLSVSGIQAAFGIGEAPAGAPFRKGDRQVIPWPLTRFPRERDVHLYFEIYNLARSPAGDAFFTVDLLLRPREPEKRGWFGWGKAEMAAGVSTAWEGRGSGDVIREHFALDTGAIGAGTFDVRVRVTDQVGDAVAERWTSVTVSE